MTLIFSASPRNLCSPPWQWQRRRTSSATTREVRSRPRSLSGGHDLASRPPPSTVRRGQMTPCAQLPTPCSLQMGLFKSLHITFVSSSHASSPLYPDHKEHLISALFAARSPRPLRWPQRHVLHTEGPLLFFRISASPPLRCIVYHAAAPIAASRPMIQQLTCDLCWCIVCVCVCP